MMKKRIGVFLLLLCICINSISFYTYAASTADAKEPILTDQECALTLSYCYDGVAFGGMTVHLYQIARVSADFVYTPTNNFASAGLILNGIETAGEWNVIRSTLQAHILAYEIIADAVAVTASDGKVIFDSLKPGLYLAVVDRNNAGDGCRFDSALVALPGLDLDGDWQYDVEVMAKAEALPPIDPDDEIQYKVLKLWRGDEGRSDRPREVEIEIFCNGESYETVFLSEDNQWSYAWTAKDDGASWMVVERGVPKGYTVTVEERENAFVLTNTRNAEGTEPPVEPPQTGDTSNILLYMLLMTLGGVLLVALGVSGKRKGV